MMAEVMHKEIRLSLCAPAVLLLFSSVMMLIPKYPFLIVSFYGVFGIMFICMFSRENRDLAFTAALPVDRKTLVTGRFLLCIGLEIVQTLLCVVFTALRPVIGLDARLGLVDVGTAMSPEEFFGLALFADGLFNFIFFPWYFRDPRKVGIPFLVACMVYAVGIVLSAVWSPVQGGALLGAGIAAYAVLSWIAWRWSVSVFERVNIV